MLIKNIFTSIQYFFYYLWGWLRASWYGVKLTHRTRVSPFAQISRAAFLGDVAIGASVSIGEGSYVNSGIIASGDIGRFCSISYSCLIGLAEHKPDNWTTSPYEAIASGFTAESTTREVQAPIIQDGVWVGANVVILRGVHIGSGAIIAAGAVVTKNVPPNEIWGGVPARFLKSRNVLPKERQDLK